MKTIAVYCIVCFMAVAATASPRHLDHKFVDGIEFVYIGPGKTWVGWVDTGPRYRSEEEARAHEPLYEYRKIRERESWGKYRGHVRAYRDGFSNSGLKDDYIFRRYGAKPGKYVTLRGYWISRHEVTQGDFFRYMRYNPSYHTEQYYLERPYSKHDIKIPGYPNRIMVKRNKYYWLPVEGISWREAIAFCKTFSKKNRVISRLPYDAEWEKVSRAGGNQYIYPWGYHFIRYEAEISGYTVYQHYAHSRPVSQTVANKWDICGLYGNVREWCMEWFDEKKYGHAARGVSFAVNPEPQGAISMRWEELGEYSTFDIGMRLVIEDRPWSETAYAECMRGTDEKASPPPRQGAQVGDQIEIDNSIDEREKAPVQKDPNFYDPADEDESLRRK